MASEYRQQFETDDSLSLELLGVVQYARGVRGRRHAHPFSEVLFPARGTFVLHWGHQRRAVGPAEAICVPPQTEHFIVPQAGLKLVYLGFRSPLAPRSAELLRMLPALSSVKAELDLLAHSFENAQLAPELRLNVMALLLRLLPHFSPAYPRGKPRREIIAEKAKAYLAANLHRPVQVREVAGTFYLSPHHFGELFRQGVGMSVKQYHAALRLERALALLSTTELSITAVARMLGYDSIHTFSKRFKTRFGQAPSQRQSAK